MRANITIEVSRQGERTSVPSLGELSLSDGGFSVTYFLEGDKCRIEYKDGVVKQRRTGKTDIELTFAEGRQTECLLKESGARFSAPIFTYTLGASISAEGCTISLAYTLADERTELMFIAEVAGLAV